MLDLTSKRIRDFAILKAAERVIKDQEPDDADKAITEAFGPDKVRDIIKRLTN